MARPSRLDILRYALTGALTDRGTCSVGEEYDEYLDQLDKDIEWLEREIKRCEGARDEGQE